MKNGMKMAAIYARVSTEDQARDGRTSIDVQHAACESEVARRGWKLMVGEYDDPGASGGTLERPGLQRLLRDCRLGLVNAVVVSKIDRVARDEIVRLLLIREFQQMGIDFVALDVPGDYQSAEGELLSGLLGNVAAFERKKIVQRTVEGQRAKAKRGDWPGGTAPYGYSLTGTGPTARPVIDEAEADMLRRATSMVVDQGLSTGEACRVLNGLGLRPRHARAWEHQNLRRVLSSQTLLGRVSWAKSERPHGQGHHTRRLPDGSNKYGATLDLQLPPILDLGRFTALQEALSRRSYGKKRPSKPYPLSGITLSPCGQFYGGVYRHDRDLRQYRCRTAKWSSSGAPRCSCLKINAVLIETQVWSAVTDLLASPERLLALASDYLGLRAGQVSVERDEFETLDRRIAALEKSLTQMVAEYLRAGVPAGVVSAASNEVDGELQMLRRRRRDLEGWRSESAAESARMRNVWALAEMAEERLGHLTLGQQAEVLRLLGIRVTVLDSTSNPRLRIQGSVPSAMTLLDAVTDGNLEHGAPLDPVAGVPGIGLPFVLEVNAA